MTAPTLVPPKTRAEAVRSFDVADFPARSDRAVEPVLRTVDRITVHFLGAAAEILLVDVAHGAVLDPPASRA